MYAIAGVSGRTGAAAAEALLAAKQSVRVIVRDARKGDPWRARGAEVAVASFEDTAGLAQALRGAKGAYLLLPPFAFGDTGLKERRMQLGRSIVEAVSQARPGHVVLLSSIGAEQLSGTGPVAALHPIEEGLRASGLPSTFLRAAYFMENWGASIQSVMDQGTLYNGLVADKRIPMIATRDIGAQAAKALLEPTSKPGRVVELAGPTDYSLNEVAATFGRILGKPVSAVQVPIPAMEAGLQQMGASAEVAALYGEMVQGVNVGHVKWQGGGATFVRGATPLEAVLRQLLGK
ncbi:MAG: NmrA family NAD(P)-binding protein [Deltaproteobacteria bacterium]|nr:NmrA family NAD(P)-binding protein [Deltaproteobacteria bacterium]